MLKYALSGDGYDAILVDTVVTKQSVITTQYYTSRGHVIRMFDIDFIFQKDMVLQDIHTTDSDTIVLPANLRPYLVCEGFLRNVGAKRVVVPKGCSVTFLDRAFHGNTSVTQYLSLSKQVVYMSNVFPATVSERRY